MWSPATRDQALNTIQMIKDTREIQHKALMGKKPVKKGEAPKSVGSQAVTGFDSGAFSLDDL